MLAPLLCILVSAVPINSKNWEHHPDIEAVRRIVQEADALVKQGKLKRRDRTCELETRSSFTDAKGVIRLYRWDVGSEDSSNLLEYYYDENGRLRFLHAKSGAVPSAHRETRLWYDETGRRLWHKEAFGGEGMAMNPESTPGAVIRDPKAHYAGKPVHGEASDACTETEGGKPPPG